MVMTHVKKFTALAGKPKIFIVLAFQGTEFYPGIILVEPKNLQRNMKRDKKPQPERKR